MKRAAGRGKTVSTRALELVNARSETVPNTPLSAGGDHDQYELLYRRYHPRVLRVCRLMLNDMAEADEVTQEVFFKAFRAHKTGTAPDNWTSWLVKIAVNACRDRHRSGMWRWWRGSQVEFDEMVHGGQSGSIEEQTIRREQYENVWRQFRHLSARQRQVFTLRCIEQWSTEEVADELGLTLSAVKVHLFRAIRALRKALAKESQ